MCFCFVAVTGALPRQPHMTCGEVSPKANIIQAVCDAFLIQHATKVMRSQLTHNNKPSIIDLIFLDEEMQVSDIQYPI